MQKRLACIWATPCGRGCSIGANFQSTTVLIPPALATGNLTVITNAMAREVTIDARGRATGVHYIDKRTRRDAHVAGRAVVLAAGAGEIGAHPAQLEEQARSRRGWPTAAARSAAG